MDITDERESEGTVIESSCMVGCHLDVKRYRFSDNCWTTSIADERRWLAHGMI